MSLFRNPSLGDTRRIRSRSMPVLALVATVALAGCDAVTDDGPLPPPPLQLPPEHPYGDRMSAAVNRMAGHIDAALGEGRGKPRELYYLVTDTQTPQALRRWYDPKAAAAGWTAIDRPERGLAPGERAFGYTRGKRAFVVAWLDRQPAGAQPIVIVSFGD